MIDVVTERKLKLTPQDIYDICDFSVQAAYDDGFLNSFIFERALYVFTAIRLYEDEEFAEELTSLAAENINKAWQYLLQNKIDEMSIDFPNECSYIGEIGEQWFEDYRTYAHSARGLLNTIQTFTGDIVSNAAAQFKEVNDGSAIQQVLETADKWGLNRADNQALAGSDKQTETTIISDIFAQA